MKNKLLTILAIVAFFLVSCGGNQKDVNTKLRVAPYNIKDTVVTMHLSYPAVIHGIYDVQIYPQVTGRIMKVLVKEGQRVQENQVLFEIDDVSFTASYESAVANLEMAKAQVETAKLTYESKTNLFQRDVISEYQLKLAKNDYLTAKASQLQAEAQLKTASNDLSYTKVRTSVSGYVGNLPYKVGTLVGPTILEPLTVVSDNSQVYADFSIPENVYLQLLSNAPSDSLRHMPLQLIMNNGETYPHTGLLYSKSGLITESTGALPIRSLFPNPNSVLLSGGAAQVVFSQESSAILVPRTAIKQAQDMMFLFKIENGKLHQVTIDATRFDDIYWVLLPDKDGNIPVKAGDVISSTTNRLGDGLEVEVIK